MTLGKGIGGGVPLAALLAREAVCCFEPGDQGGTYNGNPLMTAVGVAVMRRLTARASWTGRGNRPLPGRASRAGRPPRPRRRAGPGLLRALILDDERGPALVKAPSSMRRRACCSTRRAPTCCASCRR
jgi:acetylornithine/N-succinyldiaminopimelate aminotransferase